MKNDLIIHKHEKNKSFQIDGSIFGISKENKRK